MINKYIEKYDVIKNQVQNNHFYHKLYYFIEHLNI